MGWPGCPPRPLPGGLLDCSTGVSPLCHTALTPRVPGREAAAGARDGSGRRAVPSFANITLLTVPQKSFRAALPTATGHQRPLALHPPSAAPNCSGQHVHGQHGLERRHCPPCPQGSRRLRDCMLLTPTPPQGSPGGMLRCFPSPHVSLSTIKRPPSPTSPGGGRVGFSSFKAHLELKANCSPCPSEMQLLPLEQLRSRRCGAASILVET